MRTAVLVQNHAKTQKAKKKKKKMVIYKKSPKHHPMLCPKFNERMTVLIDLRSSMDLKSSGDGGGCVHARIGRIASSQRWQQC